MKPCLVSQDHYPSTGSGNQRDASQPHLGRLVDWEGTQVHAFIGIEGSLSNQDEDTFFLPPIMGLINNRYSVYQRAPLSDECYKESRCGGTLAFTHRPAPD